MKRACSVALGALFAASIPLAASAQSTGGTSATTRSTLTPSRSLIPFTSYGYVGANLGQSNFQTGCPGNFPCDENDFGGKIYAGGTLWRMIGLEVAYINMGKADVGGGHVKAQGANVSLVGAIPIGPVSIFGKVGGTYGWTKTSSQVPGAATGNDHGFGGSYGAGLSYDINRNLQVLGEWERHRFEFARGRDEIGLWSVGLKWKF